MMKGNPKRKMREKDSRATESTSEGVQSPSPLKKSDPEQINPEIMLPNGTDLKSPEKQVKIKGVHDVKKAEDVDFLYVYLRDMWKTVADQIEGMSEEDLFIKCRELWFKENFKGDKGKVEPENLIRPLYIYTEEQLKELESDSKSYVTIIKNFTDKWSLNNELFSLDFIEKKYGHFITDIRVQSPLIEGFNLKNSRYMQEIGEMEISEYVKYQKSKKEMYLEDKVNLDETIKFAVNLDIGNFEEQLHELYKTVPPWIYCNRKTDLQGYLRRHIPGMTVPQIYLKVAGCWTGGHQENLSLRAVNINHGPGEVEWYCMEADEAYRFNEHIMLEKNLNLLKLEGLWYIPLEDVLKRGFKISKFVQQEGDTVVLAPGTLHWVRSYSYTVNSAWNLGEVNYLQITEMLRRYDFNMRYSFRNLIPLQTLCLDLINNLSNNMDQKTFNSLKERLLGFLEDGLNRLKKLDFCHRIEPDNLSVNNMVACAKCFGETFESWFYNDTAEETEFNVESILCYHCAKKLKRPEYLTCFVKYSENNIKCMIAMLCDLKHKEAQKKSLPLFETFATPKFYIKSSVSEYYQEKGGKLVLLSSDPTIFDDPMTVVKETLYLSRRGTNSNNFFDKEALMYKIKKKSPVEAEEKKPLDELSLIEQKIKLRMPNFIKQPSSEEKSQESPVVAKTKEYFDRFESSERLSIEMISDFYKEFKSDTVNQCGEISAIQSALKEDTFSNDYPEIKMKINCIFVYFEGKINPDDALFFKVEDDMIKDRSLLTNLSSIQLAN